MHGSQWLDVLNKMVVFKEEHQLKEVEEPKVSIGGGLSLTTNSGTNARSSS